MLYRLAKWWLGRPHHKIRIYEPDRGKYETLTFTDQEWGQMLLWMGSLGCTSVPEAVARAVKIGEETAGDDELTPPVDEQPILGPNGYL